MATTISRAAAAAPPPRILSSHGPLSWSRRFIPCFGFPKPSESGNSGRASNSDSWIRDKAALRACLAPPPPAARTGGVKVVGRALLSISRVADKRAVGTNPAPAAPPAAATRADLSPAMPVNSILAVETSPFSVTPVPVVDTSPSPATPVPLVCTEPASPKPLNKSLAVDTPPSPAVAACDDLFPPTRVSKLLAVDTESSPAARADLSPPTPVEEDLAVAATSVLFVRADLQVDEPLAFATAPVPFVGANLLVEEPLAVRADLIPSKDKAMSTGNALKHGLGDKPGNLNSKTVPAVFAPVTKIQRRDDIRTAGRASLSKSWVVDKLLAAGVTTSSSVGAGSGGCSKWSCSPSSTVDYYAGPAFLKAPDPVHFDERSCNTSII